MDNDLANETPNTTTDLNTSRDEVFRALKGLMRVGLLAKGLLLRGDTDVKLVLICADKPTKKLLERVHKILLEKIELVSPEIKYSIILDKDAETILVIKLPVSDQIQPLITCKILLTSPAVRTHAEQLADQEAAAAEASANGKEVSTKQGILISVFFCFIFLAFSMN